MKGRSMAQMFCSFGRRSAMLMAHLRALIDSLLVIGGKAYVFPCHSDLYASPLPPSLLSSCDVVCHVCSSPVTSLIDENSSVFI